MDAVTYPEEEVARFINARFIPLRLPFDSQPYATNFKVKWTPTLITLALDGTEHYRTVGFLAPEELIPALLVGEAQYNFDNDCLDAALANLEKVAQEYGNSSRVAEALYLAGVCRYKLNNDPKPLKETYEQLSARFPDSEWTKRAYPYRLL